MASLTSRLLARCRVLNSRVRAAGPVTSDRRLTGRAEARGALAVERSSALAAERWSMERSSARAAAAARVLLVGEYFFDCKLLQRTRLVKRRRQLDSGHAGLGARAGVDADRAARPDRSAQRLQCRR